jgi:hypothetical protein
LPYGLLTAAFLLFWLGHHTAKHCLPLFNPTVPSPETTHAKKKKKSGLGEKIRSEREKKTRCSVE